VFSCAGHTDHKVRAAVDRIVAARLAAAARRQEAGRLPRLAEFDLLRGITGLGALLLRRPETSPLLENVLTYLVSLIHPVADPVLPGWWSPEGPGHEEVTGGHSNNGVAHGISGVLALLALTVRRGIQVAGQLDAIVVFAHWLQRFGGYWITRDQLSSTTQPRMVPGRPSWCYGDLGIARALQLAAIAVGDPASRKAAEQTALAALTDPARMSLITDASLCHGWAGLLTVTRFIAVDSPDPEVFAEPIDRLTGRLATGLGSLPKPGFLEGRAGARLALEGTDSTGWTRALLIT
jgi:class I lanthipeptide synthase